MVYFYSNQTENELILLQGEEYNHCIKSLRHDIGNEIYILNGNGTLFLCAIEKIDKKTVYCSILSAEARSMNSPKICIAISPTKSNDRIEWFIEKATELGIDDIRFINYKNTERNKINLERWNRIALSAMKQSQRYFKPTLYPLEKMTEQLIRDVNQIYEQVFMAHYLPTNEQLHAILTRQKSACIFIGPEGDITKQELEFLQTQNIATVNLGDYRLRTETAGLQSLMTFKLFNQF